MAHQFDTLITSINKMDDGTGFTNHQLRHAVASTVEKKTTVNNFINFAFRMGILEKQPIANPGRGQCRVQYIKVRPFTNWEAAKMTTYPDCIDFKKQVDAAYKMAQQTISTPTKAKAPDGAVNVKAHTRSPKSKKTTSVMEYPDRVVVTFFK